LLSILQDMGILKKTPKHAKAREGDQKTFVADISLVNKVVGWHPTVSPAVGIEKLVQWAKNNVPELRKLCDKK